MLKRFVAFSLRMLWTLSRQKKNRNSRLFFDEDSETSSNRSKFAKHQSDISFKDKDVHASLMLTIATFFTALEQMG